MKLTNLVFLAGALLATACSSEDTTSGGEPAVTNKDRAVAALRAAFVDKDAALVDKYWGNYVAHNPFSQADGTGFLKSGISQGMFANLKWTPHRVLGQGDLVVVHSTYENMPQWPPKATVFDMVRFDPTTKKIVEHWDCMQADPGTYASGHTMVDGPTAIDTSVSTQTSADAVVTPGKGLVPTVFIGGDFAKLDSYFDGFIQHNPALADGVDSLKAALQKPPLNTLRILEVNRFVAEGNFVLVRTRGSMTWEANVPNQPTILCDLFRVNAAGKVQEHWDVVQPIPGATEANLSKNGAGHTPF